MATSPASPEASPPAAAAADTSALGGLSKKFLIWTAIISIVVWAFTIHTGSTVLLIIVSVLTAALIGVLIWVLRTVKKQRGLMSLLQGATESSDARRDALAKIEGGKDANSPTNLFARAQLLLADDPAAALKLLESLELKAYPAAMQDDVALIKTQLYLSVGRTADARKSADFMNLENPGRKDQRPLAGAIVAEAWARTGKSKEAMALLDSIVPPAKEGEQIRVQMLVARVCARFAANQRGPARSELVALADGDINHLARFLMPQFRVHPELQQLARKVLEQHPSRKKVTQQRRK